MYILRTVVGEGLQKQDQTSDAMTTDILSAWIDCARHTHLEGL